MSESTRRRVTVAELRQEQAAVQRSLSDPTLQASVRGYGITNTSQNLALYVCFVLTVYSCGFTIWTTLCYQRIIREMVCNTSFVTAVQNIKVLR